MVKCGVIHSSSVGVIVERCVGVIVVSCVGVIVVRCVRVIVVRCVGVIVVRYRSNSRTVCPSINLSQSLALVYEMNGISVCVFHSFFTSNNQSSVRTLVS